MRGSKNDTGSRLRVKYDHNNRDDVIVTLRGEEGEDWRAGNRTVGLEIFD